MLVHSLKEAAAQLNALRRDGHTVGLVPTMGALHEGHASLIRHAAAQCSVVAVTIFVNPLQFGDHADFDAYPSTLEADCALAAEAGATMVIAPTAREVYPSGAAAPLVTVHVRGPALGLEGADRIGHFDGVATVVTKLLVSAGPCTAYFGEKDFQQLAVVRTLAHEFLFDVRIVGCPISREDDGLARSSRNVRLSESGRIAARCLSEALRQANEAAAAGADADEVCRRATAVIDAEPLATLSYVSLVDATMLSPLGHLDPGESGRLLVAAIIEGVRLIDNAAITRATATAP